MSITPSAWRPSASDNETVAFDGTTYKVAAENSWSFSSSDNDTLRFEVRPGDRFTSSWWSDSAGINRAEIGTVTAAPKSNEISLAYKFMVEPGATNTAQWLVMGQLHARNGASPPLSIGLEGNDRMKILYNYGASASDQHYGYLYQDSQPLQRGHWYTMRIDVKFDERGNGFADVWRDGVKIVNYDGKIGFGDQSGTDWWMGAYRKESAERFAVEYKDVSYKYAADLPNVGTDHSQ
jgi:hypothetical protein